MRRGGWIARKPIDWDAQPLGSVPDPIIAKRLGVTKCTVAQARRRRGVQSYQAKQEALHERVCPGCDTARQASDFLSEKSKHHVKCAKCRSEAGRNYERDYYRINGHHGPSNNAIRLWVASLKSVPCMDCGGSFPTECMDFDHREGTTKKITIGQIIHNATARLRPVLEEEIRKCDVVCANCHRIRTKRRNDKRRAQQRALLLNAEAAQ